MKKRRIISALLVYTLSLLAACGAEETSGNEQTQPNNQSSDDTSSGIETELSRENTPDSLPDDLDFDGLSIRLAYANDIRYPEFIQELAAEYSGDIVDDAIYERNRMIEDRLNVIIETVPVGTDASTNAAAVRSSVMAGSDDYDIISGSQWAILPQSLEGLYQNLIDNKYIDLTQPWWWSDYIDELRIGDNAYYFLNGDLSLTSIQNKSCIFFNKDMLESIGTTVDELYQLVLDGNWTYDELENYTKLAYSDLNGDGIRDEDDRYGAYIRTSTEPDHLTYTAGNVMTSRDSAGIPSLNVNTEYFIGYMEELYNYYYNNEGVYITEEETIMNQRFAEGNSLFLISRFVSANSLREMTAEYGIIPYPKYSDEQEYSSLVHDSSTIFAIPVTVTHYDEISATLEALCAQSYRTVIPAYYEMALKTKYVSDSTSGEIIDMIKNAAKTDFVYAYNYALSGAGLICRTMINNKSTDFASTWASIEAGAEQGLKELIELYEQLED